jgi:hypothetical protein
MIRFFSAAILAALMFSSSILAEDQPVKTDAVNSVLSWCGDTPCTLAKSIIFFPVFPWFQYPFDDPPTNYQFKKFNRFSGTLDLMLSKQNEFFSGYNMNMSVYKKWFGADIFYETMNNSDIDRRTTALHFIFRFMPRKHFQPFFAVGWRFISTYKLSGNGFDLSFFNYKITFSRFFNMYLISYVAWINGYHLLHGITGFEYYIYPTISVKSLVEIKYQFGKLIQGVTLGLSLQM